MREDTYKREEDLTRVKSSSLRIFISIFSTIKRKTSESFNH